MGCLQRRSNSWVLVLDNDMAMKGTTRLAMLRGHVIVGLAAEKNPLKHEPYVTWLQATAENVLQSADFQREEFVSEAIGDVLHQNHC